MGAAIDLNAQKDEQFEGGEQLTTERGGATTERGMVSDAEKRTENAINNSRTTVSKSGAIYEGIDTSRASAKLEPLLFLFRRTVVAAGLVYFPPSAGLAGTVLILTTLAMLVYLAIVKPYKEAVSNNIAIANEVFLLIFTILLFNVEAMHGFALIAFVMLAIFANVVAMMGSACLHIASIRSSGSQGPQSSEMNDIELDDMPMPAIDEVASPTKKNLQLKKKAGSSSDTDEGSSSTGNERDGGH